MTDTSEGLKAAISRHQAGRIDDAEQGYRAILEADPDNADALHLLGLIAHQRGQNEPAVELIRQAIAVNDQNPIYYANLGGVLRALGKPEDAVDALNNAVRLDAKNADTHYNMGLALSDLGKPQDAVIEYKRALDIRPNHAQTHGALADALRDQGDLQEAMASYSQCLDLDPNNSVAHYNLGIAFTELGEPEKAVACFEKTIELTPQSAEAYNNLGTALQMLGKLDHAMASFRHALELEPNNAPAHDNMGISLRGLGHLSEAEKSHRTALKIQPDNAITHNNLGNTLRERGKLKDAIRSYERAVAINPDYPDAISNLRAARSQQIPGWHAPMLADVARNDAYQEAIENAVNSSSLVLDIGTGSGLLAMMAARAGAKSVLACEMSSPLAEVAREVIAANGYDKQITVLNKKSTQLHVGDDLPERANILVSEILGTGLLNEGVLPTYRHAISDLLTSDAVVIPKAASVFGCLVQMPRLRAVNPMTQISGFDLSAFDSLREADNCLVVDLESEPHDRLSDTTRIADLDFRRPPPVATLTRPHQHDVEIDATADGVVHGLAYWFELHLNDEITVSSGPGGEMKHWQHAVQFFKDDLTVKKGDRVALKVSRADSQFGFSLRHLAE